MKKLFVIAASLLLAVSAHAQFGVIAGITSAETNLKTAYANVKGVAQYHIGATYKFSLGNLLAVQPSILYNVKGSKLEDPTGRSLEYKNGYLEIPVQLQAGFGIGPLARVYALAEPFVGCALTNTVKTSLGTDSIKWDKFADRLECGIGLGAGVELIQHVQLSVRYYWNLGAANEVKSFSDLLNDYKAAVTSKKASGIIASVALLF